MDRTILHCDLNGFYASVECLLNPALRAVPMVVAGDPEHRHGIILAKNELAKSYGVVTAETIWQARRKCPELVVTPPQHKMYSRYSKLVNSIYERYTDLVEPFGIDESWLDVTRVQKLFGDGPAIADTLRAIVKSELGLTISVGVSFNKIFAKLGSDYQKPDATTVVSRANYREILYPLPASALLYVGKAAEQELASLGIRTIGQLAACDKSLLVRKLGKLGALIHDYANGLDDSPVQPAQAGRQMKSVGNGMTFKRDLAGREDVLTALTALCDEVAERLRRYGLKCQNLSVSIKTPEFKQISRQIMLEKPTNLARVLREAALALLENTIGTNTPIRTLTVTGGQLVEAQAAVEQTSLFDEAKQAELARLERLETAIDGIRVRHGAKALQPGVLLNNDLGIEKE